MMHFCGVSETFGEGAQSYRLPTNRPTYCIRCSLPGISAEAFRAACKEAFGRWSFVCDVLFTEIDDPQTAQFLIVNHQFDGPSGILADCMLPTPGIRQQRMRIDQNENWIIADNVPAGRIDLRAVLCHEMGHGLGMSHLPFGPPPDLMEPAYRPNIVAPQATESLMMAKLYGPPKSIPLPPALPPPAVPPGDSLAVELTVRRGTETYKATGNAKRVA